MENNNTTLLWLAVIGIGYYLYKQHEKEQQWAAQWAPGTPVIPASNSNSQTVTPVTSAGSGVPVTIQQSTMNGVLTVPGRLGIMSR